MLSLFFPVKIAFTWHRTNFPRVKKTTTTKKIVLFTIRRSVQKLELENRRLIYLASTIGNLTGWVNTITVNIFFRAEVSKNAKSLFSWGDVFSTSPSWYLKLAKKLPDDGGTDKLSYQVLVSVLILERILKENNNNNKEISIIQVPYSCFYTTWEPTWPP